VKILNNFAHISRPNGSGGIGGGLGIRMGKQKGGGFFADIEFEYTLSSFMLMSMPIENS
jgi:hypothetical protein